MLAVVALACVLVLWRFAPPAPVPADVPESRFSAERAYAELSGVLEGVAAHATGTKANALVRSRIALRLRALGYTPEEREHVVCGRFGDCMRVVNVQAMIEGGDDALLVASHYDSVGAGPGASDDGVGVAVVLEVARALRDSKPTNTVVLLFTDAEELGLHGATAFMQTPLAERVKAVVNVDNRGTSGPSLMFETAGPTSALVPLLSAVERPTTSSLFGGIYELLPNDTDFTRFRSKGAVGFNFAFIGDVAHYHTDRDDLAHVSRSSLQHHGDNVLALVQALHSARLSSLSTGERAVYFDVFALAVVQWPETASLPLSLLALLLLVVAMVVAARRGANWKQGVGALGLSSLVLVAPMVFAGLLCGVLAVSRPTPIPLHAALWAPALALVAVVAVLLLLFGPRLSRGDFVLRYAGVHLPVALLSVVVSVAFAPASHLFICPALFAGAAAVTGVVVPRVAASRGVLVAVPAFVTTAFWFRVALGISTAVNIVGMVVVALALALIALPAFLFVESRPRRWGVMAGGMALALAGLTVTYPAHTEAFPQRASLVHFELRERGNEPAKEQWWVDASWGEPTESLRSVAPFEGRWNAPLPILGMWNVAVAPAEAAAAKPPRLVDVQSRAHREWTAILCSERDAAMVGLIVPTGTSVRYRGRAVHTAAIPQGEHFSDHRMALLREQNDDGVEVAIRVPHDKPAEVFVFDITRDLPSSAEPLLQARGLVGVPSQEGDLSVLVVRHPL